MRRTRRPRRLAPSLGLKVDVYRILAEAVENGITAGWYRAHKHTDKPSPEGIKCEIDREIMNRLSEIFIFPERY